MPNIPDHKALIIAHWVNKVALALSNAATQDGLTDQQVQALTDASNKAAAWAANKATKIAQTTFQDADAAFRDISDAASQAAKQAQALSDNLAAVDKELNIGAKILAFGTAVLTGQYGSALNDLIGIVGQPTPGQGSVDPE